MALERDTLARLRTGEAAMLAGAFLMLGLSFTTAAQAEPATLTLACNGTTTWMLPWAKPDPFSMGMIVNFAARTVQGFGFPLKITAADELTSCSATSSKGLGLQ
jgi:hypothetical protein